jgi:hypothetical protein
MSRQKQLGGGIAGIEQASIFYRPVKSRQRTIEPSQETLDTATELEEIQELLSYIQSRKLRYPVPLRNSEMNEMPSDRVRRIVSDDGIDRDITDMLALFCDSLEGKQLAEDKYAMLINFGEAFLLAHVRAERGMSLKKEEGEIELIRRFLDVDNILSAALFERDDGEIQFSHFTDTGSDSFRKFLGVRKRQYHYQRKNLQVICYYQGNQGVECKFEFTNDEFATKWLYEGHVDLTGNTFSLRQTDNGMKSHQVKEIRWGNKTYDTVDAFKSDFKEHSYGLEGENAQYQRIHQYPSEDTEISVYSAEEVIDHRHKLGFVGENRESEFMNKGNFPDDLYVLYTGPNIKLDSNFADSLFQDIINDIDIGIYHPDEDAAAEELEINNITFLNISQDSLSRERIEFLRNLHSHATNRTGETVSRCLTTVMLHFLQSEMNDTLTEAIQQLININSGNPRNQDVVSTKENEGPGLIEYKNKKDLEKDNPASEIVSHIQTEISKDHRRKVFIWGVTEQTRQLDGLSTQEWGDDRVASIERHVKGELDEKSIDHNEFIMQPIHLGQNGSRWAIAGVFY